MTPPVTYYDRGSRTLRRERVYAAAFLHWLYNSRSGGVLDGLLTACWLSRLYGWANRSSWSRRRIRPFVERMGIEMDGSVKQLDEFRSFGEFFTRDIDLARRPICGEAYRCVSPADGKVLAYPRVEAGSRFRIKRSSFELAGLLQDEGLAAMFAGGSMLVSRLALADYHHFHFPDSGTPAAPVSVAGRLHAGGPYALRRLVPFFTENQRMLTRFDSDHFGPMAIVEIGALTVGSIRQRYRPGVRVAKGEEKGLFELGGSSVVLLFRQGAIDFDEDLVDMTAREIESHVRMGESVGTARASLGRS